MINEYEEIVSFLEKLNKYVDKNQQISSFEPNKAIAKKLPALNNKLQDLITSLEGLDANDYEKIHKVLQEIHCILSGIRCQIVAIQEIFRNMACERLEPLEKGT